jgi:hypothetical protein
VTNKSRLISYAPREVEANEIIGVFSAYCFDESALVSDDVLEDREVQVILNQQDVQALIKKLAPASIPRCVQEKIHFRLYHDLKDRGMLPEHFPVPCDPFYRIEDRLPTYQDGEVEGEEVRVRVVRANMRRETARFNLLRGGFSHENFALRWNVTHWAPLKETSSLQDTP